MKNNISISLITTCKGRLGYLKKVLPSWLKLDYDNYDIIVVDYDDPDGTEDYIKKNKNSLLKNSKAKDMKVVKVNNRPFFNLNDARNKGIEASDSELIFMIDSDIRIRDKRILKKINRDYKNGIIFWSNLPVFNSNYREIVEYYSLDFKIKIEYPSVLPFLPVRRGITGTACFLRQYWDKCGKYDVEINREGYGFDDREFYLRYLNYVFYNYFAGKVEDQREFPEKLDSFVKLTKTFNLGVFYEIPNTLSERGKFYPKGQRDSNARNRKYISLFFERFYKKIYYNRKLKNETFEFLKDYKSVTKSDFAKQNQWFLPFFYYIYATRKWGEKNLNGAMLFFQRSIKVNKLRNPFFKNLRIKSFFQIYFVKKYLKEVEEKKYLKRVIKEILSLKRKDKEHYGLLINAYFELKDYENFIKYSKIALKRKNFSSDFKFSIMFKLAVVYKELKGDNKYFIKALKMLDIMEEDRVNFYRRASIYKHIGEYEKALVIFKELLKREENSDLFNANIYFHIGETNFLMNNLKEAKYYFKEALRLKPYHQKAKEYLRKLESGEKNAD